MVNYPDLMSYFTQEDKDYNLWILLTRARNLVFRARELELQRYGITPEQAIILHIIHNSKEKLTPAEVARLIFRRPHTVSAMLDRMEEKNLIRKTTDPNRKNMIRIEITEKGNQAYRLTTKRGPIHRIIGHLENNEREHLNQALDSIISKTTDELGINKDTLPSSD
ncbi:MAG: MarR family transcriptional regulator [Dehalococcoidales bacterium]|nr:MarR family transcriptional regulator [Dehalococcoidales bacterium]